MPPNPKLSRNRPQRDPCLPRRNTLAGGSCLRFTPSAWAKLLFLRDCGPTEVGGFGIAAAQDLLLVEDIHLVGQHCSPVYVGFEDEAVADFFDRQVDRGLKPEQFARIWVHTHPANCPLPSATDEETFQRVFGRSDWAVMFILAQKGQTYARLRFSVGPGVETEIPVQVDYSQEFSGSNWPAWLDEYQATVHTLEPNLLTHPMDWPDGEWLLMDPRWQHEELFLAEEVALDAPF